MHPAPLRRRCATLAAGIAVLMFGVVQPPTTASVLSEDYPPAHWVPADPANYTPGRAESIRQVVIHVMEGRYANTIDYFKNPNPVKVSAHYLVRSSDGDITQMVRNHDTAHHVIGANSSTIGIEHEGFVNEASWFTDEMYRASAKLTRYICDRYNIPLTRDRIVGHNEVPGNDHTDPGPHWNWDKYMRYVREGNERLDVFARGGENQLVHKWYRDGRWTESWEHLGAGLGSAPEVASWGLRRLDVFAKAPDTFGGGLMHKWFDDNTWSPAQGWEFIHVAGQIHSEPTAVSWGSRRIDVFAKGISDQLMHTWFEDGRWRHEDLGYLGGRMDGAPDVASWERGRLDVFAKGKDRQLLHWWFDENGWKFQELRGPIDSPPTAVSWGPDRIDVFAAGYPSHDLVHRWYQRGSDWQPATQWESLGGTLVGGPDAASWGVGRLDVFVRSTNNDLRHKYFVRGRGWSPDFDSLGGVLTSDPTAVSWSR